MNTPPPIPNMRSYFERAVVFEFTVRRGTRNGRPGFWFEMAGIPPGPQLTLRHFLHEGEASELGRCLIEPGLMGPIPGRSTGMAVEP